MKKSWQMLLNKKNDAKKLLAIESIDPTLRDACFSGLEPILLRIRTRMVEAWLQERLGPRFAQFNFRAEQAEGWLAVLLFVLEDIEDNKRKALQDEQTFLEFRKKYNALTTPADKQQALLEWVKEHSKDFKGDLKALRRYFGIDSVTERATGEKEQRMILVEVLLAVFRSVLQEALRRFPAECVSLVEFYGMEELLLPNLQLERWQSARQTAMIYRLLCEKKIKVSPRGLQTCKSLLLAQDTHPLFFAELCSMLPHVVNTGACELDWLRDIFRQRLVCSLQRGRLSKQDPEYRELPERDFLHRTSLWDVIERSLPEDEWTEILEVALGGRFEHEAHWITDEIRGSQTSEGLVLETSELVKMTMAAKIAQVHEQPFPLLDKYFRHSSSQSTPRIRAQIILGLVHEAKQHSVSGKMSFLIRFLDQDVHPLVAEVAGTDMPQLLEALADIEKKDASEALFVYFDELLANAEAHPKVHEAATRAKEKLFITFHPEAYKYKQLFQPVVSGIKPGNKTEVALQNPVDPILLGRTFADLNVHDYGLYADAFPGKLMLARGDRFRRKLWRVLYEIKYRASNKRQAFKHTVGREYKEHLRVHSGAMDEVTATTVPGERVVVDREGTWGRHLPLVDDMLHLPLFSDEPVDVVSSHATVRIHQPKGIKPRLKNRMKLTKDYAKYVRVRLFSLGRNEARERRQYAETLEQELGIRMELMPHTYVPLSNTSHASTHLTTLFSEPEPKTSVASAFAWIFLDVIKLDRTTWVDRLEQARNYLLTMGDTSQHTLAVFSGFLLSWVIMGSVQKRQSIRKARAHIPLSIGGWGTRGKSGTERIKAAFFHGLGYQVFVKTTGCEAMFIHALPGKEPLEVFIYRPYDKATIWEQKNLLELGSALNAEVFLWECMALNPKYVELLQHEWMQDDVVTLTNAFPDHEDIQGPAGMNVAEVITRFIPKGVKCYSSEYNFLPLFRTRAKEVGTELIEVSPRQADLIAEDILKIYPYQEHPRNIALVTSMAIDFGIRDYLAMALMAEYVVPDLGVLKTYPRINALGRRVEFINGMSANERTGCVNNWRRLGFDTLSPNDPERMVLTVVNNRDDRVSRSEVFGRVVVEDLAADRHVLIGTNLRGLVGYIDQALTKLKSQIEIIARDEVDKGIEAQALAEIRLKEWMSKVRIAEPKSDHAIGRVSNYLSSIHKAFANPVDVLDMLDELFKTHQGHDPEEVKKQLEQNAKLQTVLFDEKNWVDVPPPHATLKEFLEVLGPPTLEDVKEHSHRILSRMLVYEGLRKELEKALSQKSTAAREAYHQLIQTRYEQLYKDAIIVVEDPKTSGDKIILTSLRSIPPGSQLSIMGIQNIKGTGLDFVYRWVALGKVYDALVKIERGSKVERDRAFSDLESFGDHGLLDSGYMLQVLPLLKGKMEGNDQVRIQGLQDKAKIIYERRSQLAMGQDQSNAKKISKKDQFLTKLESNLDFLDSIRRYKHSGVVMQDLIDARISLGGSVVEMRELYGRQKGGWLFDLIRQWKGWFNSWKKSGQ